MSRLLKWIRFSQMIRIRPDPSDLDPKHCQKHHCFVVEIRFKYSFLVNEGGGDSLLICHVYRKSFIFFIVTKTIVVLFLILRSIERYMLKIEI